MLITAIQIRRIENSGTKMRGVASINLDNMVVIHDIKVLEADGKSFLAMPSKQTKVGTFKDMVHPINVRVREAFETLIIGGYEKAEKEGYTKIDLIYNDSGKKNLTEQTDRIIIRTRMGFRRIHSALLYWGEMEHFCRLQGMWCIWISLFLESIWELWDFLPRWIKIPCIRLWIGFCQMTMSWKIV